MSVPEQIKKQSKAIQDFYADMHGEGEKPEANVEDEEKSEEKSPEEDHSEREEPPQQDTWEQRYRTLQGMHNADRKSMQERIAHLETLLSNVKQPVVQPKEEPKTKQKPKYITEAEEAEYEGAVDVMRKAAREETDALREQVEFLTNSLKQMQTTVLPRVENVQRQQQVSAEQAFWSGLNSRMPNWQSVNDDPKFQGWLLSMDPKTGITLQTYLEDAQQALDVERVVAFFDEWTAISGEADRNTPQPKSGRKSELEKQVVPGKGRTQVQKQGDNTTYNRADIAKFYDDVRSGKYKGRDQERARIEADIFAAQREGRFINTA